MASAVPIGGAEQGTFSPPGLRGREVYDQGARGFGVSGGPGVRILLQSDYL